MATCAAGGCGQPVPRGVLMCKPHWFAVPKPLRDEVWRTWRAVERDKTDEAVRAYRAARLAAIDAVCAWQAEYDGAAWEREP